MKYLILIIAFLGLLTSTPCWAKPKQKHDVTNQSVVYVSFKQLLEGKSNLTQTGKNGRFVVTPLKAYLSVSF